MFFKLSLRNAKRSFKDYMIYFLTLTFGVCIFYMFNALDAQQAMLEITTSKLEIIKNLSQLMGIISIFVAFILGFLMIYANHFLIRRRKKELGLYLTLGMNRHTVNLLLVIESLIIAIFALISGLVLGTFLSHGLSIVTAQLFAVDLKSFTFIFSSSAACKSIVFFTILFVIVIIFNTVSIAKYKLIDLLQGEKKNETLKMPNFPLACFFFILSLVILIIAYTLASINGLRSFDTSLLSAILLGCIGTYLFFYSIAGIVSKLCIKYKTFYYKNINLFIVNQVMSKIKTHHISMSVICLMLFFTIGVLSTGLSMSKTLTSTLESTTPYDATLYVWGKEDQDSLIKQLESYNFPLNDIAKEYLEFNLYQAPIHYSDLFSPEIMAAYSHLYNFNEDLNLTAIKLSDFNNILKSQGATPITLNPNEYVISSNVDTYINLCKEPLGLQKKLTISGQDLSPKYRESLNYSLETSYFTSNQLTLVLNDEFLVNASVSSMYLNINFFNNKEECEALFTQSLEDIGHNNQGFFIPYTTKISTYEASLGLSTIVTYIGIYIGFVFLIASAAILALQQLLEITDHTAHYEILRKIGVPYDTLKRSLFTQIALYFFTPLSLALVHSIVGLNITNNLIVQFGSLSLGVTTFITAFFLVVIYGGYFLTTYITAKNVILNNGYVR